MEEKKGKGFIERFKEAMEEQEIRDKTMMLINCPVCDKQVSKNAVSCPNCGNPIKKEEFGMRMVKAGQKMTQLGIQITVIMFLLGLLFVLFL